jgi:hypothetical protein
LIVTLALARAAYGQVPASNDISTPAGNTGVGSRALSGSSATDMGDSNTAVGDQAMQYNSTGSNNTALWALALAAQATQLRDTQRQIAEMRAAVLTLQSKDQLVAQR